MKPSSVTSLKEQSERKPTHITTSKREGLASLPGSFVRELVDDDQNPLDAEGMREDRLEKLQNVPRPIIRQAWHLMAHLLLSTGSHVAHIGSSDGLLTYAMAVLNPDIRFTGIETNKTNLRSAQKKYRLPNLLYRTAPEDNENGTYDAIISADSLHNLYSSAAYDDRAVTNEINRLFGCLKNNGYLLIQDYALQGPGQYVLIEMPDMKGKGPDIEDLSEPELLIWFSENIAGGFFLEEMPARYPSTRLFRLPYRWAYEFVSRKDDREKLQNETDIIYSFFTQREYRKALRSLGGRVVYTAPHRDPKTIRDHFDGKFHLLDEQGKPLGNPPTGFIALAQKKPQETSLKLEEMRPAKRSQNSINIRAMRDEKNGKIVDIVSRNDETRTDILPYRTGKNDRLDIFVMEGLPRGLQNTVPRTGLDIDNKKWSGHAIEAITVPASKTQNISDEDQKAAILLCRDYIGLKPAGGATIETGPVFFPAPDFIDDKVETRFIRIEQRQEETFAAKSLEQNLQGFAAQTHIREISAQRVLNAIAVGLIPDAKLEMQIYALFRKMKIPTQRWVDDLIKLEYAVPENRFDKDAFKRLITDPDHRFKNVKGTAGQYRTLNSTFIDEGRKDDRNCPLAAKDMDFVISEEHSNNVAAVLPLNKDLHSGDIMLGFQTQFTPVMQRHTGNGATIKAPVLPLPTDIQNMDQARRYVAEQFNVGIESVSSMGESYFTHIGTTPQRVFPFVVAAKGKAAKLIGGPIQFAPVTELYEILDYEYYYRADIKFLRKFNEMFEHLSPYNEMGQDFIHGKTRSMSPRDYITENMTDIHMNGPANDPDSDRKMKLGN